MSLEKEKMDEKSSDKSKNTPIEETDAEEPSHWCVYCGKIIEEVNEQESEELRKRIEVATGMTCLKVERITCENCEGTEQ